MAALNWRWLAPLWFVDCPWMNSCSLCAGCVVEHGALHDRRGPVRRPCYRRLRQDPAAHVRQGLVRWTHVCGELPVLHWYVKKRNIWQRKRKTQFKTLSRKPIHFSCWSTIQIFVHFYVALNYLTRDVAFDAKDCCWAGISLNISKKLKEKVKNIHTLRNKGTCHSAEGLFRSFQVTGFRSARRLTNTNSSSTLYHWLTLPSVLDCIQMQTSRKYRNTHWPSVEHSPFVALTMLVVFEQRWIQFGQTSAEFQNLWSKKKTRNAW